MENHISEETIQLILSKTDVLDVIGEYVHLKKNGRNYTGLCPFHSEKTPSFSVSPDKQLYYCFGCSAGGNVYSFLMEMEGYSFLEAVRTLGEKTGIHVQTGDVNRQKSHAKNEKKEWMLKAHHLSAQLFHHMLLQRKEGKDALAYLKKRGFKPETLETFQIGYAPNSWDFLTEFLRKRGFPLEQMAEGGLLTRSEGEERFFDRFRGRIIFPIWNAQGNIVAFGGRMFGKGQPKYLNSPETSIFQKNRQLFHLHQARTEMRKQQTAILFEGYVDVISAWQGGIKHCTATLGTSLSEDQCRILRRNAEQVILCYDGDKAGVEATTRASEMLIKHGCMVKVAPLPQGMDPDDYISQYGSQAFQENMLFRAQSLTAYRLEVLRRDRNLQDDEERMAYIRESLTIISRLNRAVERDHYLRRLADEFSLSLNALKQEQYQLYQAEKRKENRDKAKEKWNNSKKNGKHLVAKQFLPAFHNAERELLAHMLMSEQVTRRIAEQIGSSFNIDEHSALAAYLYAFYANGYSPDIRLFLSQLDDPRLIQLATELSMMTVDPELSEEVLQDYIRQVLLYPKQVEIENKEAEKKDAERRGDVVQAAKIAMDIVRVKQQLKDEGFPAGTFRKEGD